MDEESLLLAYQSCMEKSEAIDPKTIATLKHRLPLQCLRMTYWNIHLGLYPLKPARAAGRHFGGDFKKY